MSLVVKGVGEIASRPSTLTKCITPVYTYSSGRWSYLLPLEKSGSKNETKEER